MMVEAFDLGDYIRLGGCLQPPQEDEGGELLRDHQAPRQRQGISDCAGLWSDLSDEAVEEIITGVLESKRLAANSLEAAEIEGR